MPAGSSLAFVQRNDGPCRRLPEGATAVHKHGYVPDTHGTSQYGACRGAHLDRLLYRPVWLEWDYNPTMQDLMRASWNGLQQMAEAVGQ
jgi:hypothetical protein